MLLSSAVIFVLYSSARSSIDMSSVKNCQEVKSTFLKILLEYLGDSDILALQRRILLLSESGATARLIAGFLCIWGEGIE